MDLNIKLRLYPHEQRARWYIEGIKSFDKKLSAALHRNLASRWLDQGEGKMQNLLSIISKSRHPQSALTVQELLYYIFKKS